jgi:hypothetical protein
MSETRPIPVGELRLFVTDPTELAKGTEIADKGGLAHLSTHENKLFADAAGSGASPYKVQILFGDAGKITGRCSCMAARSRPFCKHASALLVSWARAPDAFAVADAAPAALPGSPAAKRVNVKKGKVDAAELRKKGVDQAFTLLSELWQTGVVAIAHDRAGQVADLATSLRELGLRRLASRTLELSSLLVRAARRDGSFPAGDYAELVSDLWLTVRKLEKHLGGEPLADEHVEELIGKTWTKKDRKPITGLDLVEYAFLQRTTPDGFFLRESRFLDLVTGDHFSEKQILPAMLAKRLPAKPSYRETCLTGVSGSLFPSFAPKRLDLAEPTAIRDLDQPSLARAMEKAIPSIAKALTMLAERRRDPFAPSAVPVLLRIDAVVPDRDRVRLVDEQGGTLFLAGGRADEDALMTALASTRVTAIAGDLTLEGALPSLVALAIVGERDGALRLVPLGGDDASAREESGHGRASHWADAARRASSSSAATLLGEVRDDLALGFQEGAPACATSRFLEPLATRLGELSLGKQADALRAVVAAKDPIEALDGVVKVHQVLGIALSRLAGAAPIDRAALVRIPRMPSVAIMKPAELLSPEVAVSKEARGELHRWERAYHVAVSYERADPATLLRDTDARWGDGFAAPFVVDAAKTDPTLAMRNALSVLSEGTGGGGSWWRPSTCRLAKLTAIRVLGEVGTPEAHARLAKLSPDQFDAGLLAHAHRAMHGPPLANADREQLASRVVAGSAKEDRATAIEALARAASLESIGVIRAALRDRTTTVRKAAAYALASLGDTGSLDTFTTWLDGEDHELAKVGAHAIGYLGDLRGAGAVLAALARGFSPSIVRETLELLGPWVLGPLLDLIETSPELAKKTSVGSLVKTFPRDSIAGTIVAWIENAKDDPAKVARRAIAGLDITTARGDVQRLLLEWLVANHAAALEGREPDARALAKKVTAVQKKLAKPSA